ncbi:MAG: DUF3267 domain-containing protein [Candidatus Diapherotrites archaeon]|nr:DUF3267 domain-containing protein [Candidatus Diapherotrites archaeon]
MKLTSIIRLIAFPGIAVHETAHLLACTLTGTKITKTRLLMSSGSGFIEHERPANIFFSALIAGFPLLLNTLIGFTLFGVFFTNNDPIIALISFWLGASCAIHAFPSSHDASNIWNRCVDDLKQGKILSALFFPIAIFFMITDKLRFIWFDIIFAILLFFISWVVFSGIIPFEYVNFI